nr:14913_t:CDS:2 [Entrophospora candida]
MPHKKLYGPCSVLNCENNSPKFRTFTKVAYRKAVEKGTYPKCNYLKIGQEICFSHYLSIVEPDRSIKYRKNKLPKKNLPREAIHLLGSTRNEESIVDSEKVDDDIAKLIKEEANFENEQSEKTVLEMHESDLQRNHSKYFPSENVFEEQVFTLYGQFNRNDLKHIEYAQQALNGATKSLRRALSCSIWILLVLRTYSIQIKFKHL